MTASEAQNAVINMQFMADNKINSVYVNSQLVPNSATPISAGDYGFQIQNAVSVAMQGNWVEGLNTIIVGVQDQGSYSGFIAQLNPVSSIPLPKPIIVDPNVICITEPIQLNANIPNGIWSASCTNCISSDGIFNPSCAGIGQHTITYSKNCQSDFIELIVCGSP